MDILKRKDKLNAVIGEWATKYDGKKTLFCSICDKDVPYDRNGMNQINQHVIGGKHKKAWENLHPDPNKQKTFQAVRGEVALSKPLNQSVLEAEIVWLFKLAEEDWSFESCDHLDKLFVRMFPGSAVAEKFGTAHTKASYSIRHGLGPALREALVKDINLSSNMATLMLDETTTKQVVKQMDFLVRYWSEKESLVITRYLDSRFFGHAKAVDLCDLSFDVIKDIDIKLLLSLSMDGPNINKSLWGKVNEKLISLGFPGLLPLVVCCLHIVHKGFQYGCVEYGSEVESLAIDLHGWFKIAPCKREDIADIAEELGDSHPMFQRHVTSRWLTLVPALNKVEEHWESTKSYFLDFLPSQKEEFERYTSKNERYDRIVLKIKDEKHILVQMAFVTNVSAPYMKFNLWFQGDYPLIHLLFSELKKLLVCIMKRFLQSNEINGKSAKSLLKLDVAKKEMHLPLEKMEVGAKTERLLKALSPFEQKKEKEKMLQFYIATTKQLQRRLPLENPVLFNAVCLHPGARTQANSLNHIERLAKLAPHIISEGEVSQVKDEWRLYQVESEKKLEKANDLKNRIDQYWNAVFEIKTSSGSVKYTKLQPLVKAFLSLPNGNAAVERSLSDNKNTVTCERTKLMEETIVGLRLMKEYARNHGGAHNVVITEEMINGMKEAKRLNDERIRQEQSKKKQTDAEKEQAKEVKRQAELNLQLIQDSKETLQEKDLALEKKETKAREALDVAQGLLKHATDRLVEANGDAAAIGIATIMLQSSQEKVSEVNESLRQLDQERKKIRKRKTDLLENCQAVLKKKKDEHVE